MMGRIEREQIKSEIVVGGARLHFTQKLRNDVPSLSPENSLPSCSVISKLVWGFPSITDYYFPLFVKPTT